MNAITPIPVTTSTTNSRPLPSQSCTEIPTDNAALVSAITHLAGHINTAQYRFLKLLAALIEREAWSDGGAIKSPAHWLNYYCGIDLGAAREKVRVAKCLAELPQIDAAFATGAISYSKVRAMTRSATTKNEAGLLNIARHGTAQHVEMLVRKYQRVQRVLLVQGQKQDKEKGQAQGQQPRVGKHADSYGEAASVQFNNRELHWHYDDDGMLVIRGRLTPEDGAMFINAVNGALEQMHKSAAKETAGSAKNVSAETSFGDQMDPKDKKDQKDSMPQKRADALVLMAESVMHFANGSDVSHTTVPRPQLVIHIEQDSLLQGPIQRCSIEHGPFLSHSTARRLACDSGLLPVLEDGHGNVLNVGRKTRAVSPALRRALSIRDHGCRFPGCTESRFVDAHHIHHWCDGGETNMENLVLLCRRHHRLVHEQGFEIANQGAGEITFRHPERRQLPAALYPQFSDLMASEERLAIEHQHQNMGIEIDEYTALSRWQGEKMDYDMAISAMIPVQH